MVRKIFICIILLVLVPIGISFSKTIIVAETGGDYTNIQSALNVAIAGDTILVREKSEPYFEKVAFLRSGNASDGHIVLMNYPNENPILDGNGLNFDNDWPQGLVRIMDQSYIKVIGLEIRNIIVSDENVFPAAIWLYGSLNNVEISSNKIHTIQQNANEAGAHGLAVYGKHYSTPISDILIDGNEIFNCKLGWSETLVLNGNVENFVVSNNIVHDINNIAYDFIGHEGECSNPELDQTRNGIVAHNIAYNIDSRGNQAYGDEASADGFYVDGGKNIIIERNLVYNCNIGIEIASEHSSKTTSGIIVRNNIVKENMVLGIAFGGYDAQRGATEDCIIINNTLYKNNTLKLSWGAEILSQYYCSDNMVANNIIHSKSNVPMIKNTTKTGINNQYNNNIYYTEGNSKWHWDSITYSNFENYKSASGREENSIYADALFLAPKEGDFKIASNSPTINKGKNYENEIMGKFDYLGNDRLVNDIIDIGAIEYNSVTYVESKDQIIESSFELLPAYPNPFNESTIITFIALNKNNYETYILNIYDALGRKLVSEKYYPSGGEQVLYHWNARHYTSGVYYVEIRSSIESQKNKIVLLK